MGGGVVVVVVVVVVVPKVVVVVVDFCLAAKVARNDGREERETRER